MKQIQKPTAHIPSFYEAYLTLVPDDGNLIHHLHHILTETRVTTENLTEQQLLHRYAPGKWTIKDILVHLSDCERVIIYRAMRISRGDATVLPGFDENLFVENAHATNRTAGNILAELSRVRAASIAFIETLSSDDLANTGNANGYTITAGLLVNHLYGHHRHHLTVIKERYLA